MGIVTESVSESLCVLNEEYCSKCSLNGYYNYYMIIQPAYAGSLKSTLDQKQLGQKLYMYLLFYSLGNRCWGLGKLVFHFIFKSCLIL